MFWNRKKKSILHLDEPHTQLFSQNTKFSGWYASDYPLNMISLFNKPIENFEQYNRPDVERTHIDFKYITGFSFTYHTSHLSGISEINLAATNIAQELIELDMKLAPNKSWEIKKSKLKSLGNILDSSRTYRTTTTCYDFIDKEAVNQAGIIESTAISSHNYTPEMLELIKAVPQDSWILDCGAGYRETEFKNVVLFEIEPYVSTDVRGICESLPFKDNSFDLVFSIVVLEHVRDPHRAIAEMLRVLKPGGKIWVDVAFMQPFHGYPNHFFNMTKFGLRSLFPNDIIIDKEFVPRYGTPIWSITWILQRYSQGLPEETKETFEKLTVRDLLKNPELLTSEDWVRKLSSEVTEHLAATNTLIATKKT